MQTEKHYNKYYRYLAYILIVAVVFDFSYDYYQLLRVIMFTASIYFAIQNYTMNNRKYTWFFAVVAYLFNPIFPVYLNRFLWKIIDILIAIFLLSPNLDIKYFYNKNLRKLFDDTANVDINDEILTPDNNYNSVQINTLMQLKKEGLITEDEFKQKYELLKGKQRDIITENDIQYHEKIENKYIKWGFRLGIVSVFLGGTIGMLPLVTIVISAIGLVKYDSNIHEKRWQGEVGLIMGLIFFIVNLYNYGHLF